MQDRRVSILNAKLLPSVFLDLNVDLQKLVFSKHAEIHVLDFVEETQNAWLRIMVKIVDAVMVLEEALSKGTPFKTLAILLHVVPTHNVLKRKHTI